MKYLMFALVFMGMVGMGQIQSAQAQECDRGITTILPAGKSVCTHDNAPGFVPPERRIIVR